MKFVTGEMTHQMKQSPNKRSAKVRKLESSLSSCSDDLWILTAIHILDTFDEIETTFSTLDAAAQEQVIPLDLYLPRG